MNVLVTGGAGFIGSHLVDHLVAAGYRVSVLDNLKTGTAAFLNPEARFVEVDLRDEARVRDVLNRDEIDCLLHFAAQVSVRFSVDDPVEDASINIHGSLSLLQAATAAGVRRCLVASSGGAVYGDHEELPTTEDQREEPDSPYGISKLIVDRYVQVFAQQYGLRWQVMRLANVYGPRQDPFGEAGVVAIFARAALDGRPAVINGDGLQTRDFVYVEDVCRAALALLEHEADGIFNVGTGCETNILDLDQMISGAAGCHQPPKHGPAKPGEQRRSAVSPERLKKLCGWEPQVPLPEGIQATLAYFRQQTKR